MVERTDLARRIQIVNDTLSEWLPTSGDINCGSLPIMVVSGFEKKGVVELQREIASVVPVFEASSDENENKVQEKLVRFSKLGGNPIWDSFTKHTQSHEFGVNHKNFAGKYNKSRKPVHMNESAKDTTTRKAVESANAKSTVTPIPPPSKEITAESRQAKPLHSNGRRLLRSYSRKQKLRR